MDDIVRQALAKWPNVPDCYGWLALDARGDYYMRDDQTQANGAFGSCPAARGSRIEHDKLNAFIHRNYAADKRGAWFFQNGPQRVYVELEAAPFVWRVPSDKTATDLISHNDYSCSANHFYLDEIGRVFALTELGFGIIHTQDVHAIADRFEQLSITPVELPFASMPEHFGFVRSPATALR